MSWEVFRTVKPDGTIVATAKYIGDSNTRTEYLGVIERCPRCDGRGYLSALYIKRGSKWRGPYYIISHHHKEFDKERYHQLRKKGTSSKLATELSRKTVYDKICHFGRHYPKG